MSARGTDLNTKHHDALHSVNACPFTIVLPRFLSFSPFTFIVYSIGRDVFRLEFRASTVIPVIPPLPGASHQGQQYLLLHNGSQASFAP